MFYFVELWLKFLYLYEKKANEKIMVLLLARR